MEAGQGEITERIRPGLLGLPNEILDLVCEQFCFHCGSFGHDVSLRKDTLAARIVGSKGQNELKALCLTSRKLRRAAQPVLFHHLFLRPDEKKRPLHVGLRLFMRTIDERRDLRIHVKSLDIETYEATWRRRQAVSDRYVAAIKTFAKSVGVLTPDVCHLDMNFAEDLLQVLLAGRLPALEEIFLVLGRRRRPDREPFQPSNWELFKAWTQRGGVLRHVKHMELDFVNSRPVASNIEALLVNSAPNLKVLSCSLGGSKHLEPCRNTHDLHFSVRRQWDGSFGTILGGFPNLTRFCYHEISLGGPVIEEILESLLQHRGKLEALTIQCFQAWPGTRRNRSESEVSDDNYGTAVSLKRFFKLRHLSIDVGDGRWIPSDGATAEEAYSHLFPESLQTLFLGGLEDVEELFSSLSRDISAGKYNHLRHGLWEREDSGWSERYGSLQLSKPYDSNWLEDDNWKKVLDEKTTQRVNLIRENAFPNWDDMVSSVCPLTRLILRDY